MSPDITWRNGGPLMLGGLVGGSERCCCENPTPPICIECGDLCSYFIEVVEPTALALKSNPYNCLASVFQVREKTPSFYLSLPSPAVIDEDVAGSAYSKVITGFADFYFGGAFYSDRTGLIAYHEHIVNSGILTGVTSPNPVVPGGQTQVFFRLIAIAEIQMACIPGRLPSPFVLCARMLVSVSTFPEFSDEKSGASNTQLYFVDRQACFDIESSCIRAPNRQCIPSEARFRAFATPMDIDLSAETTSLGPWTTSNTFVGSTPTYGNIAQSIGESVLEQLTTKFKVTSRPSCNNIPADCGVPIEGRVVYFPRDGVAVYGYEFGTPKTDVYDFGAWEFAHDGVADGTAESPYVFNAKRFAENPAGFILEEHNLEVFCALDDTVTPPVSRWYVREFVYCTPEFGRQTTDQWISEIPTYPEPDRETPCEGVSAGDPVPVGITEYERVDGYPIVDFGDPCDPPPPIGLQITDGCS